MAVYKKCERCGANNDPGERCDCAGMSDAEARAELERIARHRAEVERLNNDQAERVRRRALWEAEARLARGYKV